MKLYTQEVCEVPVVGGSGSIVRTRTTQIRLKTDSKVRPAFQELFYFCTLSIYLGIDEARVKHSLYQ